MRDYLARQQDSLQFLVGLTAGQSRWGAADVERALTWTLRRKTLLLHALSRFRHAKRLAELRSPPANCRR